MGEPSKRPWSRFRGIMSSALHVGLGCETANRDPRILPEYGVSWARRPLTLAALCTLVACGGHHSNADPTQPASALVASYCAQHAQEYCTMNSNCCGSSDANCQAKLEAQCSADLAADLRPTEQFDSVVAENCLTVVRKVVATCSDDSLNAQDYSDEWWCSFLFRGLVPAGGTCTRVSECVQTEGSLPDCVLTTDTVGKCSSTPVVGPSGECSNTLCAPGLYCDKSASIPTCQPRKAAGEPCSTLLECWPPACTNGVCTPMTMTEECEGLAAMLRNASPGDSG
jgi:hypothetical protein